MAIFSFGRKAESSSHLADTVSAQEQKASQTAPLIYMQTAGQPAWTRRHYTSLSSEGYAKNVVAYRCVRMISEAAASVPWQISEDGIRLDEHPLITVLRNPNEKQCGNEFLESVYSQLMLSGNAYIERVVIGDELAELHALRPDRMKIVPGPDGWPEAYEYTVAGQTARFEQQDKSILHLSLYHPLDDHYGLAPMAAAQMALDVHNAAAGWNKALLDNAARPSGALVFQGGDGNLSEDQFDRLKSELENSFQGSQNAGRPMLLEGGLDWKAMSLSPRDMDFMEAKHTAAREIALAFGVPPMLLGIPGDNTFSNYQEANRAFWRQTIIPMLRRTAQSMEGWMQGLLGSSFKLSVDESGITALANEQDALWRRAQDAQFLTLNERRRMVGLEAIEGGDNL